MRNKCLGTMTGVLILLSCGGCVQPIERSAEKLESSAAIVDISEPASELPQEETNHQETSKEIEIEQYLQAMTLEEKAAQLFIVVPEALVESVDGAEVDTVTAAGEMTKAALEQYPVGGLIYMGKNLISTEQTTGMLHNVQEFSMELSGLPLLLCVDEEGGTVARISGKDGFGIPAIADMAEIAGMAENADTAEIADVAETEDTAETGQAVNKAAARDAAYETGVQIGSYLSELGFNLDFAPVADVWSNPENTVVKKRSFGAESELVSEMALAVSDGLNSQGVYSTFKHFPGHGATAGDTHEGYAYTDKTLEELRACELVPFQAAVDEGADFIMAAHISLPEILDDATPASLSYKMLTEVLREEMGYDGIIVTDALNMGAVVQHYTSEEAAVKALQAGADLILMPEDFKEAYQGVLDAVEDGRLSQERIDASVRRILEAKLRDF